MPKRNRWQITRSRRSVLAAFQCHKSPIPGAADIMHGVEAGLSKHSYPSARKSSRACAALSADEDTHSPDFWVLGVSVRSTNRDKLILSTAARAYVIPDAIPWNNDDLTWSRSPAAPVRDKEQKRHEDRAVLGILFLSWGMERTSEDTLDSPAWIIVPDKVECGCSEPVKMSQFRIY